MASRRDLVLLRRLLLLELAGCQVTADDAVAHHDSGAGDFQCGETTFPDTSADPVACGAAEEAALGDPDGLPHLYCYPSGPACPSAEAVAADLTGLLLPYFDPSYGGSTASCCEYTATVDCGPAAERTDACCYVLTVSSRQCWVDGRPFRVDGTARMAELPSGSPWAGAARAEHASVASFARFALELMALGAPLELLRDAARAMADEVEHARICAAQAGVAPDFGPLDVVGALGKVASRDVLVATLRDGAIGETLAAAEATAGASRADADSRAALLRIAADETRHAALAWRTVRWILASRPELVEVARATIVMPVPDTDGLLLTAAERRELAIATFATVIGPLAAVVFGEPTRALPTPTCSNREQSLNTDARWPRSAPLVAGCG